MSYEGHTPSSNNTTQYSKHFFLRLQQPIPQSQMAARNVLIAYDNSDSSNHVLQWIIDNKVLKADDHVTIAIVINEDPSAAVDMLSFDAAVFAGGQLLADEYKAKVENLQKNATAIINDARTKLKDFNADGVVLSGSQYGESIVEYAKKKEVDLIVIGSRGMGWFKRQLIGSVSDYVVHHSECPVLIAKVDNKKK